MGRGPKAAALPTPPGALGASSSQLRPVTAARRDALSDMARNVIVASWWPTLVSAARHDAASTASSIVAWGSSSRHTS
jgi:hypothetical protein